MSAYRCDTLCDPNAVRSLVARQRDGLMRRLVAAVRGTSTTTRENCERFVELLKRRHPASSEVLIIGSGTLGDGTEQLLRSRTIRITGIDVYESPNVDCVADAHYLPFANGSFDGVWIQAVLEHVVDPAAVVGEIHRVLKPKGIVYAETPFLQQVHEGAYDYTRFTVVGHRYLFRDFELVCCGGNKGAEVALAWSIRYFIWALTRSSLIGTTAGLAATVLLRPFRVVLDRRALYDASSGVFFMGIRSENRLRHAELPSLYQGMQRKKVS